MLQREQSAILSTFINLSYHLSLRPLFCLFLCDRLRQVLLYCKTNLSHVTSDDLTSINLQRHVVIVQTELISALYEGDVVLLGLLEVIRYLFEDCIWFQYSTIKAPAKPI